MTKKTVTTTVYHYDNGIDAEDIWYWGWWMFVVGILVVISVLVPQTFWERFATACAIVVTLWLMFRGVLVKTVVTVEEQEDE